MVLFRHSGIGVRDIEVSIKFYEKYFNLKVEKVMDEKGSYLDHLWNEKNVQVKTAKLSDDTKKICLELLELVSVSSLNQNKNIPRIYDMGPTHFALTVKNLDVIYEKMKNDSIDFVNEPIVSLDGNAKIVFCKDPDGSLIELVELIGN